MLHSPPRHTRHRFGLTERWARRGPPLAVACSGHPDVQGLRVSLRNRGLSPLPPDPLKSSGSTPPVNGDTAPGGGQSGRRGPWGPSVPERCWIAAHGLFPGRGRTSPRGRRVAVRTAAAPRTHPGGGAGRPVCVGAGGPAVGTRPVTCPSFTQTPCARCGPAGGAGERGGEAAQPPRPSSRPDLGVDL